MACLWSLLMPVGSEVLYSMDTMDFCFHQNRQVRRLGLSGSY